MHSKIEATKLSKIKERVEISHITYPATHTQPSHHQHPPQSYMLFKS